MRGACASRGYLAASAALWVVHTWGCYCHLGVKRPRMLLHLLPHTGQSSTTKNYLVQNGKDAHVEKSRLSLYQPNRAGWLAVGTNRTKHKPTKGCRSLLPCAIVRNTAEGMSHHIQDSLNLRISAIVLEPISNRWEFQIPHKTGF